jgi:hypothetical protein
LGHQTLDIKLHFEEQYKKEWRLPRKSLHLLKYAFVSTKLASIGDFLELKLFLSKSFEPSLLPLMPPWIF